ncbi:opsin, ultraviolet-sensitive-like isoform X1 [Penaeus japonicus]|uniref:opsin, ultraviolet-sensitive-like isoform X1 n=1 Tax=Penaeus japonicus TaxID=27405 RepID=UPI001C70E384|nr:opsin, ultraviolet-sensitive-like isoform X1 [Penaeus japonicus]XP_042888392.1 opsin, ultraviolet-sensitive-like isoform X1 [Penaeus japonicus]
MAAPVIMPTNVSQPRFDYYGYEVKMNGWNTPPEYLSYVDEHWLKFEAPNPMMHHLLGVLYIFLTFCSCAGNGCVIWIFLTSKSLRSPSNMLIVNLALADFVMMLKTPVFIINSFNEGPVMGMLGCQIYGLMGAYTGPGAACTNAAIAFDRYRTITNPLEGRLTSGQVTAILLFIYAWITPWVFMPFLEIWNRFVPEGYLTSCTFDYMSEGSRFYVVGIWFCMWFIPMIIITTCYYLVYSHVAAHEKTLKKQASKMNVESLRSGDKTNMRQEVRVAKVGATLTSLFLISWTPYAVVAFTCTFGRADLVTPFVSMIPACTCKIAACIDPFVYAINHPKYRVELTKKMPWFCIHEKEETSAPSETVSKDAPANA